MKNILPELLSKTASYSTSPYGTEDEFEDVDLESCDQDEQNNWNGIKNMLLGNVSELVSGSNAIRKTSSRSTFTKENQNYSSMNEFMPEFLKQVTIEENKIKLIHEKTSKISKLVQALTTSVAGEEDTETESKMNDIVDSITVLISQISNDIKKMKRDTEAILDQNSAEARMQKNVENNLLKKLQLAMHEFWCVQQRFRAYSRERYIRQCKIVNPKITRKELDVLMETPEPIFATATVDAKTGATTRGVLHALAMRQSQLYRLEQSIVQLSQMSMELSVLLSATTESCERIEESVKRTRNFLRTGTDDLRRIKSKKEAHFKHFIIGVLGAVFLIVVLVIVVIMLSKMKKKT